MAAVAFADFVGLIGEVEGLGGLAGLQHVGRLFVEDVDLSGLRRGDGPRGGAHVMEQSEALLKTRGREVRIERHVSHAEGFRVRIVIEHEGIVAIAQTAAELAGREVHLAIAMRKRRDDIGRHAFGKAIALREPSAERADARDVRGARCDERAVHAIRPADGGPVHAAVVAAVAVMHAADERELIHAFGHLRQQFGDVNAGDVGLNRFELAADLGGRFGFRVPKVDVARCTAVEDQNDRFGLPEADLRRTKCLQLAQAEAQHAHPACLQDVSPRNAHFWQMGLHGRNLRVRREGLAQAFSVCRKPWTANLWLRVFSQINRSISSAASSWPPARRRRLSRSSHLRPAPACGWRHRPPPRKTHNHFVRENRRPS